MSEIRDVTAVFWDIGGVILALPTVRRAHESFVETLCDTYTPTVPRADALNLWRDTIGTYFGERDGTTFRPARDGYRLAVDELLAEDPASIPWRETFRETVADYVEANPDAVAAIRDLADAPVHQGVISDVDHDQGVWLLELFDVRTHLDSVTSSEGVGKTKPDPEIFATACRAADVRPSQAVMIGDRYENDMVGGRRAGMTTVAYGADEGPAVDARLEDLRRLPALLDLAD